MAADDSIIADLTALADRLAHIEAAAYVLGATFDDEGADALDSSRSILTLNAICHPLQSEIATLARIVERMKRK